MGVRIHLEHISVWLDELYSLKKSKMATKYAYIAIFQMSMDSVLVQLPP